MAYTPTASTSSTAPKLALNGGPRLVTEGFKFHTWPCTDESDEQLVLEAVRQSNHSGGGPHVVQLEKEFGEWNGNKHVVATNCGTAALHMCVAAAGCGVGDEVITPALSWTSSATCVIHHSAIPVFVDVDTHTQLIDPSKIEAAITPKTKAILVVHYWGLAADMDAIMAIARKHNLVVIEDACQAHGAKYKGQNVGTFGHVAAFSCNQNKNLCGGEAGFFVTDDKAMLDRGKCVMSFSDMRPAGAGRDYHEYGLGYKYGTNNLSAAFTLSQLRKLDLTNAWAQKNWHRLNDALEATPHLVRPYCSADQTTNGYAYCVRTDRHYAQQRGVSPSKLSEAISNALTAEGTPMWRANWMLPAHGVFQGKNAFGKGAPWTHPAARQDVDYSLDQFPVTQDCIDSSLWNINLHRPPNKAVQIDALAASIRKVYENLDELEVNQHA